MRVLVTGVTGQVGGALKDTLAKIGSVYAADRGLLDLSRPGEIAPALERIRPDLIVNAGAYTAVDRAEDEKDLAHVVNAEAPGVIARWAAGHNVPLVHFSTDYVFDGSGTRPWREDDRPNPLSVYGASKLAGEDAVRTAGGPHLIIRTQWVYAASGKNFLRTIARAAADRKVLRIVNDQYGAPTSARLIADIVAQLLAPGSGTLAARFAAANGLLNVAASGDTTWHGFAVAIVQGLKVRGVNLAVEDVRSITTAEYPTKARRPLNSRLDLTRLRELFGIIPPTMGRRARHRDRCGCQGNFRLTIGKVAVSDQASVYSSVATRRHCLIMLKSRSCSERPRMALELAETLALLRPSSHRSNGGRPVRLTRDGAGSSAKWEVHADYEKIQDGCEGHPKKIGHKQRTRER